MQPHSGAQANAAVKQIDRVVERIDRIIVNPQDDATILAVKAEVNAWMKDFPIYG